MSWQTKRKKTERQTTVFTTAHRKLKSEQYEPTKTGGDISGFCSCKYKPGDESYSLRHIRGKERLDYEDLKYPSSS